MYCKNYIIYLFIIDCVTLIACLSTVMLFLWYIENQGQEVFGPPIYAEYVCAFSVFFNISIYLIYLLKTF